MIRRLEAGNYHQPFKGPFTINRVEPGAILADEAGDSAFGQLSNIDHATLAKRLTIKMHEHVNDEIFSYVWKGVSYHKDSAGFEAPIEPGKLMLMNAGESFWHEEKTEDEAVEMLQIFFRPREADLPAQIQFHDKPTDNRDWYEMVGPEGSGAPLFIRQSGYVLDAHPEAGDILEIPQYDGMKPFLYVLDGSIQVSDFTVGKQEAVTDLEEALPPLKALEKSTVVLFVVDLEAKGSMAGTISGKAYQRKGSAK